jgi:uncharacterized Ntn-hydrolase superfamily protein
MGLTFSIVGVDVDRGLIGAAGGLCTDRVLPNIVESSYNHVFGKGAFVTNAVLVGSDSFPWSSAATELGKGTSPETILSIIADPTKDDKVNQRQYGLVDFQGRSASYTGSGLGDAKYGTFGAFSDFAYAAQGSNLFGTDTITGMVDAFRNGSAGCNELVDRLFLAMMTVSGPNKGQQATNCPNGATTAFLRVDHYGGDKVLEIFVDYQAGRNPFDQLRAEYETWRANNACSSCPPQDKCPAGLLDFIFGASFRMHSPFFGLCSESCVSGFLVGIASFFGWRCNGCLN